MIYNYLDWVKRQRKHFGVMAVFDGRRSRHAKAGWTKGFYDGCARGEIHACQILGRLQKDIEARIAHDHRIVVMPAHKDGYDEILS